MITRILSWFRKPVAVVEAPWTYLSHEYRGLDNGLHVYLVSCARGVDRSTRLFQLHGGKPAKDADKMAGYFRSVIEKV